MAGTDLITWLQGFRAPWLDAFFVGVTSLGDAPFYVLALAVIYLAVDRRKGYVLAVVSVGSALLNDVLKAFFAEPRPPAELHVIDAEGLGFPSGHAQSSTVFWGTLSRLFRRWEMLVLGAVLIVLVGLSRIYLGVHTLRQVMAGFGVGLVVVGAAWAVEESVETPLAELALRWKLLLALVVPLAALVLFPRHDAAMYAGALTGVSWAYAWELHTVAGEPIVGWRVLVSGLGAFGVTALPLLLLPPWLPLLWLRGLVPALALGVAGPVLGARWREAAGEVGG